MLALILFILVLGILVLVHELGHFIAARKLGMKVEEFGFGFPPKLVGFRRGETEYTLNWIPFGGFVRIAGEDQSNVSAADTSRTFRAKPFWKQAIVLLAGVTMNVLLAWLLFSAVFAIGATVPAEYVRESDRVQREFVQITDIRENTPAAQVDVQLADELLRINGTQITSSSQARELLEPLKAEVVAGKTVAVDLTVQRGGSIQTLSVTDISTLSSEGALLGIAFTDVAIIRSPIVRSLYDGATQTGYAVVAIVQAFGTLLQNLFSGQGLSEDVAGPVGIAQATAVAADQGISPLLQLIAILSINLAVLNVLPLPALDGGRFAVAVIERIRGQALPERATRWVHGSGFVLLLLVMLAVSVRDIARWIESV